MIVKSNLKYLEPAIKFWVVLSPPSPIRIEYNIFVCLTPAGTHNPVERFFIRYEMLGSEEKD